MRPIHGGRRRDANEPEIVEEFERHGCVVRRIDAAGLGDLLVWPLSDGYWRQMLLVEVKALKGRMSPAETQWQSYASQRCIRVHVVRSAVDVRALLQEVGR